MWKLKSDIVPLNLKALHELAVVKKKKKHVKIKLLCKCAGYQLLNSLKMQEMVQTRRSNLILTKSANSV